MQTGLSTEWFHDAWSKLQERRVAVALPNFKVRSDVTAVRPKLESLGIHDAFSSDRASFTSISPVGPIYLGDLRQQAVIAVDERGTEAAAVTAAQTVIATAVIPEEAETFRADHPFLFFVVRHDGFVIFSGQLVNPTST